MNITLITQPTVALAQVAVHGLLLLGLMPLVTSGGEPVVDGATTTVFAVVAGPQNLAFAQDGTLFVGRDSCGGGCIDALKIWRVGLGGSPVTEFGNAPISDPDALIVDPVGKVSGIAGSILVGGESPNYPTEFEGIISRVARDGTVSVLFGPGSDQVNPSDFIFDSAGRLLITDYRRNQVLWTAGADPQPLCDVNEACYITVDSANRIVVSSGADSYLRLFAMDGTTLASPWFTAKVEAPVERGPGGFWGTDVLTISSAGELLRVALNGTARVIGTGFGSILYLKFGLDGALYASDPVNGRIIRIVPSCALRIGRTFYQADLADPDVPTYFALPSSSPPNGTCSDPATGRACTSRYGCALCSLATMCTAFNGLESTTPTTLDTQLKAFKGYSGWDTLRFENVREATGYAIAQIDPGAHTDADIDAYLTDHVCRGDGVILEMSELANGVSAQHFILVTGKTDNDWTVFDPGWQNPTPAQNILTLSGHRPPGFTTLSSKGNKVHRTFSVAGVHTYRKASAGEGTLSFRANSPVELLVTDPSGNRVGWNGTNDVFEIAEASYTRDYPVMSADDPTDPSEGDASGIKTVVIPNPVAGVYSVLATGTASGAYTLDIETDWPASRGQYITYSGTATNKVRFTNTVLVIVPPVITGFTETSNGIAFSWRTQTNVTYSVEATASLAGSSWIPPQTIAGTGAMVTATNTNAGGIQCYRVRAQ